MRRWIFHLRKQDEHVHKLVAKLCVFPVHPYTQHPSERVCKVESFFSLSVLFAFPHHQIITTTINYDRFGYLWVFIKGKLLCAGPQRTSACNVIIVACAWMRRAVCFGDPGLRRRCCIFLRFAPAFLMIYESTKLEKSNVTLPCLSFITRIMAQAGIKLLAQHEDSWSF